MSDASFEQWRALVERGLRGAPLESLTATTLEGIAIAPLYVERDRPPGEGIPWAPRAERGLGPMRSLVHPIDLAAERRGGASAAYFFLRGDGPIELDVPDGMIALVDGRLDHASRSSAERVRVVADPWWAMRPPRDDVPMNRPHGEAALALVADALGRGGCALGVAPAFWSMWHGANAVDALGLGLASLAASLRSLEARGVDLEHAVLRATISLDVDTDFFLEIAKLRAARRLFDRLLRAASISARPLLAAHTSERSRASLDTSTNLIRFTIGAAAALIGGADVVCVMPHAWSERAEEIPYETARKTPLVLALESHLAAAADPARGSPYLETLTAELCARAWQWFQEIERGGGIAKSYEPIFARLADSRKERERAVATRALPLVGVSRFPSLERGPRSGSLFDGSPFEQLRARAPAASRVIVLGACPEPRIAFAREVAQLASQEVEVVRELDRGQATFVILAAPDAELGTTVADAARALAAAGAKVAVAARPGAHEQALREAGVGSFVYVGADLVAALGALLGPAEAR